MAPGEFWELSPTEFWLIHEAKTPVKKTGGMTDEEIENLNDLFEEAEAKWQSQQKSAESK